MSCKFDKDIINKYLDNTIDPLELIFLKEHIKVCEDCKYELRLMTKLDESLYDYFQGIEEAQIPENFSLSVLDMCYEEKKRSFRERVKGDIETSKIIFENATRFTSYIPGTKIAAKTAKAAGRGLGRAMKGCLNYGVRKLISGTAK